VYTLGEMLGDLRRGVWGELAESAVRVDPFRRNLQRSYLELVGAKLNPAAPGAPRFVPTASGVTISAVPRSPTDARALLRGELRDLDTAIRTALARTPDRTTRLHLQDARTEIERILNPER
jgi:hypothetical protein